jgi:hypothetical protein
MSEPYTVTDMVIQFRVRGGPWGTWSGIAGLGDDEPGGQTAFLQILRTRHDPAKMQFRLVRRTAVIVDEVLAVEREDGTLDVRDGLEPS